MYHNDLLSDFYGMLSTRYPRDGQEMTYAQWIEENTKLRGRKFSFKGYEFQKAIANDFSQSLSVKKPSQVGMTEIQIRKFLAFLARNRGLSGIYTLPNEKMYKRLSKTRVKPLVQGEKAFASFAEDEKPSQSMDLYEINGSFGYFTGNNEADATSIPADFLCHDELDLSDQVNIGLFQSRLQNSRWRLTHRFSTPTLPGYAIDATYAASDQHEYMCRCSACGHYQIPLFDMRFLKLPGYHGDGNLPSMTEDEYAMIDIDGIQVICESCQAPLDLLNPEMREWVPRHPGRRSRGYFIRPLMNQALMPAYILNQLFEMRRLDNMKGWWNTVLGETFSDGSNQLTDDQIKRAMMSPNQIEISKSAPLAVGIDVGQMCHVTIGVVLGDFVQPISFQMIHANEIEEWVRDFCANHNVVAGAMDRYPYTPTADAVFAASGHKIIPVDYKTGAFIQIKRDEFGEISYAQINRTASIDRVVSLIRRQMLKMTGYAQYGDIIKAHLKDMVRIEHPEKDATWEKVTGNDHFFHALGYLQISVKIYDIIATVINKVIEDPRTMIGMIGVKTPLAGKGDLIYRTRSSESGVLG